MDEAATLGAAGAPPPRWRVGLMPVRVDTGQPAHDWLQNGLVTLAQQALEGHPRIDLVPTVAALAAGTAALPPADQARRAAHGLGLDGVVQASLRQQGAHLWLDWQCLCDGRPVQAGSLREVAPTALGARLAQALVGALLPDGPQDVRPVSDDAFVNQAYARGMELLLQEDYAAALPLLQLVCELSPDDLAAALARVRCLGPIGHPSATTEALALMPRALARGDTRLQARVHVALFVSRMRSRPQEALQDDAAVMSLAARPEHAHWWREDWLLRHLANRGMLALFGRHSSEGAALLARAAKACRAAGHRLLLAAVQRTAAMAHLALGQVDLARRELDEAAAVYQQTPQTVAMLHLGANRVLVDLAQGEFDAACAQADAFCEALSRAAAPMLPLGTTACAAMAYLEAGRREALARLLLLLEERPDGLEHHPLGSRLLARGALALLHGDPGTARQSLRQALDQRRSQPGGVDARVWAALLLQLDGWLGDADGTEVDVDRVGPLFDADVGGELKALRLRNRAACLLAERRPADAAAVLDEVVAHALPGRLLGAARVDLAWLWLEAGELARAQALLQDAGPWRQQHPAGLATDALLQAAQGHHAEAVALQQAALQRHEGLAPPWHHEALRRYAAGAVQAPAPLPWLVTDSWWPVAPAATNP